MIDKKDTSGIVNKTNSSSSPPSDIFSRAFQKMVKTNKEAYGFSDWFNSRGRNTKTYSREEVEQIIESGSLAQHRALSEHFFQKNGFYKRILIHYATLLKYTGILIANPSYKNKLSDENIAKRYHNAVDFLDRASLQSFFTDCALKVLKYGAYFGLIRSCDKKSISILELPASYSRSDYKDEKGIDLVEFNVTYFNQFTEEKVIGVLECFPTIISAHYRLYQENKVKTPWILLPSELGVYFNLYDESCMLLNTIPPIMDYEEAIETEKERDLEEIKKIIVQKIPHLNTGELLFEPPEAEEMHTGSVKMMGGNRNVSVLTTYADVDAIVSKTSADSNSNNLAKMVNNIYDQAGTSSQLFAASGNLALETSIKNDISLMMTLAKKFEQFITNIINKQFGLNQVFFKYTILPVSIYNEEDYIDSSIKLASMGYSLMLPMIAMGFSQSDLDNLKDLENDVLELREKLIPPRTAYTESGDVGAPEKKLEQKASKTIKNQESIDKGGSSE